MTNTRNPFGIVRKTALGTRVVAAMVGVLLTIMAGHFALQRPGGSLISLSYDLPFVAHRAGTPEKICIVYVDGYKDRSIHAQLVRKLDECHAAALMYDFFFTDPEKSSLEADLAFAEAIRDFRGVDWEGSPDPGRPQRPVILPAAASDKASSSTVEEATIYPLEPMRSAAGAIGSAGLASDGFSPVRELVVERNGLPSIAWLTAKATGAKLDTSTMRPGRWINYAGPPVDPRSADSASAIRAYDAAVVVSGGIEPALLRDKIVVIGSRGGVPGKSREDVFTTPFHRLSDPGTLPLMPGVEVHANMLQNLRNGDWLERSGRTFDLGMIVVAGLLAGAGLSLLRPAVAVPCAVGAVLLLAVVAAVIMHYGHVWFPWAVVALAQIPVALFWGTASHFYLERFLRLKLGAEQVALQAEQVRLRELFSKYLSPEMVERMGIKGFNVDVGGEMASVALMVTDIESFSGMCERVGNPNSIVKTLNEYFERTTGHIFDHKGTIVQFIGDSIFAAWGTPLAPLAEEDAAVNAVKAAWKLFETDKLFVEGDELRTRFGLHFGNVVAANIGSSRHMDYALVGDAVNLVHRLEGLNKMLGTSILLSGELRGMIGGEFRTRCVGRFRVKGRRDHNEVHELLGPVRQGQEPEWITLYTEAQSALARGEHARAKELFEIVSQRRGSRGDGPSKYFLDCLERGEALEGGVVELKEK